MDIQNITLDDLELIENETIEVKDIDLPMLRGLSAYQVAVKEGYIGTEEQWLASLKGDKGDPGEGDMKKSVYDTNNNGVVDNAEKVNNHTVEKDVPYDAEFTDTVYDDTILSGRVTTLENAGFITKAVNDLINYYTKSETYTQAEINQKVSAIPKFAIEVVQTLPTQDISTTTVYLVTTGTETQNLYTEYIYVNNTWEKLGTQTVDLTNYYNKTEVDTLINNIDPLPAGGTQGQVLTKKSSTNGDATWKDRDVIVSPTKPTTKERVWVKHSKNLFNIDAVTVGYWVNTQGQYNPNASWNIGEKIEVEPSTDYTISRKETTGAFQTGIAEYDENDDFVQQQAQWQQNVSFKTYITSSTTKYIRPMYNNTYSMTNIQVEKGSEATSYEPYTSDATINIDGEEIYNKNAIDEVRTEMVNNFYKETILFEGNSNSNITLNDNVENYNHIKIIYKVDNQTFTSIIDLSDANSSYLTAMYYNFSDAYFYWYTKTVNLSENSLTKANAIRFGIKNQSTFSVSANTTDFIYITKVIGLKKGE